MKTYFFAFFMLAFSSLSHSQNEEIPVKLKQINIVKTNFRNLKSGEIINKNILFKDGKLSTITTSDVTQNFFYNQKGLLDMSVKEKTGSNWKEVINYAYDGENRLIKFTKKYDEEGKYVTKTVTFSYEGARIKAITKKTNSQQTYVEDIEYIVENGLITRRSSRDRNQQIFNKTEYVYSKDNIVRHKGLLGDKSIKTYGFDDKNSADLLIVKNIFGENYKVIVPLVSFHEEEFTFQSICSNNELSYTTTAAKDIIKSGKFKYNTLNYPASYSLTEDNGMLKTVKTYIYE